MTEKQQPELQHLEFTKEASFREGEHQLTFWNNGLYNWISRVFQTLETDRKDENIEFPKSQAMFDENYRIFQNKTLIFVWKLDLKNLCLWRSHL